jgi:hypothetical protein
MVEEKSAHAEVVAKKAVAVVEKAPKAPKAPKPWESEFHFPLQAPAGGRQKRAAVTCTAGHASRGTPRPNKNQASRRNRDA